MTKLSQDLMNVYFPVNTKGERKPRYHAIDVDALGHDGKALFEAKQAADKAAKEAREAFEAYASAVYENPKSVFEIGNESFPYVPDGHVAAFAYRFGPQVFATEAKEAKASKAKASGGKLVLPTANVAKDSLAITPNKAKKTA